MARPKRAITGRRWAGNVAGRERGMSAGLLGRWIRAVLLLAASIAAVPAFAQEDDQAEEPGLEFGGGIWRPAIETSYFHSDNFYNQSFAEQSASGVLIRPKLSYVSSAGRLTFNSLLDTEYGQFDLPGSADDYLDASVRAQLDYAGGTRHRLDLLGMFQHEHDPFGIDRTEDPGARRTELDRWNQTNGRLRYRFGAAGAAINAEVAVSGLRKAYITNRGDTDPLNYDSFGAEYQLSYRYSPKSSVLVDVSRIDVEFDSSFGGGPEQRDGRLYRARLGMRWLATAKTAGDVRIGVRRRSFDNGAEPLEGLDWQAGIQWSARAKTLIELRTFRSDQESYVSSSRLIDLKAVNLEITQTLTARLKGTLGVENTRAKFIGGNREDDIWGTGLRFSYLMRRYLHLEARAQYTERESSTAARDYDRLNSYIGIRVGR